MVVLIPAWAGGPPADAPPRPGTAAYDAYTRQHQAQSQTADLPVNSLDPATSPSASAIH